MRAVAVAAVVAAFAFAAAGASAARVDEPCVPSGDNGATACTIVVRTSVSGNLESDVVTECLGEDVFLSLDAQVVEHFVYRPDGTSELQSAHATVHGSGSGVVTGTTIQFNEVATEFIEDLPGGGEIFHAVSPTEVVTNGGAQNLELTVEAQEVIAPDGTTTNEVLNVQEKCGSDHETEHLHD